MTMVQHQLEITTRGQGLYEFTSEVDGFVRDAEVETGLVTAFCRHTSCSLIVQENADPDVKADMLAFFDRLVPEGMDWLTHVVEGADDMPAHIKSALNQVSISVPVTNGRPVWGKWQGIYLFEHRQGPHRRQVFLHLMGA